METEKKFSFFIGNPKKSFFLFSFFENFCKKLQIIDPKANNANAGSNICPF